MERNLTLVALFAAIIVVLGFMPSFSLVSGVPISAQSLGVMLAGTVLGSKRGAAATALVVLVALIGLPVLAGGRGGLGVLAGPTVGFLLGWIPAAYVAGLVTERWQGGHPLLVAISGAVLGGIVVMYACGTLGMMAVLQKGPIEAMLLNLPFIPGDLIKATIAGFLTREVWRARPALRAGV